jgi:hypothetical protein
VANSVTATSASTGFGTIVSSSGSGSDPVARFGDVQREFELPPDVMTTLLEAPNLKIRGSVFEGTGPYEQWFGTIVLTTPWQDRSLEIKMRQNLDTYNASGLPQSSFRTLDISLRSGNRVTPITDIYDTIPWELFGHQICFRRIERNFHVASATIGRFKRECVDVAGEHLHVYICSTPASEYYGHLRHLSLKYAHLDTLFIEVRNFTALTGLLPELWGVHPMSETTKKYVKEEAPQIAPPSPACNATQKVWAGAGGFDMENFTKTCVSEGEGHALIDDKFVV